MRSIVAVLFMCTALSPLALVFGEGNTVPDLPEVRGPFTLTAGHEAATGRNAFAYRGRAVPPVIRVSPGSAITLRYVNNLPNHSDKVCALGPCANMSNLHVHGLHVSPEHPQDDVLTMMSSPGETLTYKVGVLSHSAPGLYLYPTPTRTGRALARSYGFSVGLRIKRFLEFFSIASVEYSIGK